MMLDDYSGPGVDLRRVSLSEAVDGIVARCFVEGRSLCCLVGF